jgi:hypothetical protein
MLARLFAWLFRKRIRKALREFVSEMFIYDHKIGVWDPIGSIDVEAMRVVIGRLERGYPCKGLINRMVKKGFRVYELK